MNSAVASASLDSLITSATAGMRVELARRGGQYAIDQERHITKAFEDGSNAA